MPGFRRRLDGLPTVRGRSTRPVLSTSALRPTLQPLGSITRPLCGSPVFVLSPGIDHTAAAVSISNHSAILASTVRNAGERQKLDQQPDGQRYVGPTDAAVTRRPPDRPVAPGSVHAFRFPPFGSAATNGGPAGSSLRQPSATANVNTADSRCCSTRPTDGLLCQTGPMNRQ